MAKIVKLTKDNVQIYPQTITDAIADVRTRMVLSAWMEKIEQRLTAIETIIGSGSTSEYIDNLWELLQWFSGVTDTVGFKELVKKFVEAQDADDIPTTEIDESSENYPSFEDMFDGNDVPSVDPDDTDVRPVIPDVVPNNTEEQNTTEL